MEVIHYEAWDTWRDNNQDGYGKAIMDYAERWADLMEAQLALGIKLENCAKQTSYDADTDGITGFMYGAAVSVLAQCWKYGEQLRRWHNLDIQIHNEGELANEKGTVLNPALMTIEIPEEIGE